MDPNKDNRIYFKKETCVWLRLHGWRNDRTHDIYESNYINSFKHDFFNLLIYTNYHTYDDYNIPGNKIKHEKYGKLIIHNCDRGYESSIYHNSDIMFNDNEESKMLEYLEELHRRMSAFNNVEFENQKKIMDSIEKLNEKLDKVLNLI